MKKINQALILLLSVILLSAFSSVKKDQISRFELALALNHLLLSAMPDASVKAPEFPDLSAEEQKQISVTSGLRIMSSFAGGEFKPQKTLHNHEVLHYLHRTWQVLKANARKSELTRELGKIVGLGRQNFYANLASSYTIFSESDTSFAPAKREILDKIYRLGENEKQLAQISISIEDAKLRQALPGAFVSINSHAYVADDSGKLLVSGLLSQDYEILVSAPGYHSLKFKRNLRQKSRLKLRLRPVQGKILVKAFSQQNREKIKRFSVRLIDGDELHTDSGEVLLKPPASGYYEIEVCAEGHAAFKKKVFASKDLVEIEALL